MFKHLLHLFAAGLLLSITSVAFADSAGDSNAAMKAASEAAMAAKINGPADIPLGQQATLKLPENYSFIPRKQAVALMDLMGNETDSGFYGLVIGDGINGFVSVDYVDSGYIKDDDAKNWDVDKMLKELKDGTEAGNEERRRKGIPEFVVTRWVEKPAYDSAHQRLIWSAELRDKKPSKDSEGPGVNYNTYQLGREGYISMNLVTDLADVDAEKPFAKQLLSGLTFKPGKRYADFDSSTDKVAAYGLAALVGGLAAKKLGLLAMLALYFAKFGKIIAIAFAKFGKVIAIGVAGSIAALRKLFKGKQESAG